MLRHGRFDSFLALPSAVLRTGIQRDVATIALAVSLAILTYLPRESVDPITVVAPWAELTSSPDAGPVAGNESVWQDTLMNRLAEPGRAVSDIMSFGFPGDSNVHRLQITAALFGSLTVAVVVAIMRRGGVACVAAAASGLAFAFQEHTWLHAVVPNPQMGSLPLLALSVLVLLCWSDQRRTRLLGVGIGGWLLSTAGVPLLLLCTAPAVLWFVYATLMRESTLFLERTGAGTSLRVGVLLAVTTMGVAATGAIDDSRVHTLFSSEMGLLGLLFLSLGLVHCLWLRPTRPALFFALSLAGVLGWMSASTATDARLLLAALFFASPLVGCGMSVIVGSRADRTHTVTATAVLLVLPTVNAISNRDVVADDRRSYAHSALHARALAAVLPVGGTVLLFPDTREPLLPMRPHSKSDLDASADLPWRVSSMAVNQPLFAVGSTRTRLEFLGFQLGPAVPVGVATPLSAYLRRLEAGTVVAAVAARNAVARTARPIEHASRLFGGGRVSDGLFYGVVGLARGAALAEQSDPDGVELRLNAGDVLDATGRLMPAGLHVVSTSARTRISVDDRVVLEDPTGVGIVVLQDNGRVERVADAFAHDGDLWIPAERSPRQVSRLLDWKPCMPIGAHAWVDVSELLTGSGLGVLFPLPSPTRASLALYVWDDARRIRLRQRASSQPRPGFTFEAFDRARPAERVALDRLLRFDGLEGFDRFERLRFVQLLHVSAPESEFPLSMVRFNRTGMSGMARLLGAGGAQQVIVCGA